jgi:hypothetical protein
VRSTSDGLKMGMETIGAWATTVTAKAGAVHLLLRVVRVPSAATLASSTPSWAHRVIHTADTATGHEAKEHDNEDLVDSASRHDAQALNNGASAGVQPSAACKWPPPAIDPSGGVPHPQRCGARTPEGIRFGEAHPFDELVRSAVRDAKREGTSKDTTPPGTRRPRERVETASALGSLQHKAPVSQNPGPGRAEQDQFSGATA